MRNDCGAALLIALTVLAVLSILASALIGTLIRGSAHGRSGADRMHHLNRAESGVSIAIERLETDASWRGGKSVAVPGGSCEIAVKPGKDADYQITSITAPAGSEKWRMILTVGLRKIGEGPLEIASRTESWR